jgi:glucose uptake protein
LLTPTTWLSSVLLLVLSFFLLGSWVNTFKLAGNRWRFELFSFDFALGALLLSVLAAYTLGTLGSDLGFSDQMLVAPRTSQAMTVAAGCVFALGNMLLLSAVSLLGMSVAFPLVAGVALVVAGALQFNAANPFMLGGGLVLLLATVILEARAARSSEATLPGTTLPTSAPPKKSSRDSRAYMKSRTTKRMSSSAKGITVSIISGVALGIFFPILDHTLFGDFGVGPYAGLLLFVIGMFGATVVLNFYFMNIAIHGGGLKFDDYFRGKPGQHLLGLGGGALWASGGLAAALAICTPKDINPRPLLEVCVPLASAVLAVIWGTVTWKENAGAPSSARVSVLLSVVCFLGGIALFGLAKSR